MLIVKLNSRMMKGLQICRCKLHSLTELLWDYLTIINNNLALITFLNSVGALPVMILPIQILNFSHILFKIFYLLF